MSEGRKTVIEEALKKILDGLVTQISHGQVPTITITSRSKNNIYYDEEKKVWVLGDKKTKKTCKTIGGSKEVLRLANMVEFLLDQLRQNKVNTLRNVYYIAMNWIQEAAFEEVSGTAEALENLEIVTGMLREELGVVPDISGAVFGPLIINTRTRGGWKLIDCCKDVSEAGFAIPPRMEDYEIVKVEADIVIAIETGGMYQRFVDDGVDKKYNAAFIHTKGQSSRATRLLIKRIKEKKPSVN